MWVPMSLLAFAAFCIFAVHGRRIIDLTYDLEIRSPAWYGNPPFKLTNIARGMQKGGFWAYYNWFSTPEHIGTHIDAPAHFAEKGRNIHQIPLKDLIGPAVVLRAREEAKKNQNFNIDTEFIHKWESVHGNIPENAIVMLDFDWRKKYLTHDNQLIFGSKNVEQTSTYQFPAITHEAVTYLAKKRHINVIGVDTTSVDNNVFKNFPSHRVCAKNNITIIENVANLHLLPTTGSTVYVTPIKLNGGSGVPTRVFAFLDKDSPCAVASINKLSLVLLFTMLLLKTLNFNN